MTAHDRIIAELATALDAILRADNIYYAHGVADYALKTLRAKQTRDKDGYFMMDLEGGK